MKTFPKKLIALDLETTHLDAKEGRIMEVAAVSADLFYDEQKKEVGVKFGASFNSLVNPEIEVPKPALAITGINQHELEQAPSWKDAKLELEKFLHDNPGMVTGHNVNFDITFLESQGVKLDGSALDTLAVSQNLIPLIGSHSLDFLAEQFGVLIGVSHRALEDSKTCLLVLAKSLNEYLLLPVELQKELAEYAVAGEFAFAELLSWLPREQHSGKSVQQTDMVAPEREAISFDWEDRVIYSLPVSFGRLLQWVADLAQHNELGAVGLANRFLLSAVPESQQVLNPAHALCEVRFNNMLKRTQNLNQTVWQVIIRLLVSRFFVGSRGLSAVRWLPEERSVVSQLLVDPTLCLSHKCAYANSLDFSKKHVYFAENQTFLALVGEWGQKFSTLKGLFFELSDLETVLVEYGTNSWNLEKIRGAVQQVYPLTQDLPCLLDRLPREIEDFANELDLFFGILHLVYLKKEGEYSENLTVDFAEEQKERFQKLLGPVEKFMGKLERAREYLMSQSEILSGDESEEVGLLERKLSKLSDFLTEFFQNRREQTLYWFKFNDRWVDLSSAPKSLEKFWQEFEQAWSAVSLVDTSLPRLSRNYFEKRLGLADYSDQELEQGEAQNIVVRVEPESASEQGLLDILRERASHSAIVILPNLNQLQKFFEFLSNEQDLPQEIIAYRFGGSLSAIRSRLTQDQDSRKPFVLLLTKHIALHGFRRFPSADLLFVQKLPFDPPNIRPAHRLASPRSEFLDNALPRALFLLHTFISRFAREAPSPGDGEDAPQIQPEIYLGDHRIMTEYDQEFVGYLSEMTGLELLE